MNSIKVKDFFLENRRLLKLENLTGEINSEKEIVTYDIHRPGLALSGFVDIFSYERVQVLGNTEIGFLDSLRRPERKIAIQRLAEFDIPCIFITNKNVAFKELLENCKKNSIPVFRTPISTTHFVTKISDYLEEKFAPQISKHGTLVDVYGIGVLLTGRSGIGKSEVALDLIERGHRLVVDDLVLITRKSEDVLIGAGNDIIQHYIEIRGLGIIDVKNMFGIRAIRQQKRIEVEVLLEDWDASEDYERLGLEEHNTEILGVKIPEIHLPIFPGKNITVIVETIALNTLLQIFGISAAKELDEQLLKALAKRKTDKEKRKEKLREYFEHDIE